MKNKNSAKNKKTLAREDTSSTELIDDVVKRVIANVQAVREHELHFKLGLPSSLYKLPYNVENDIENDMLASLSM